MGGFCRHPGGQMRTDARMDFGFSQDVLQVRKKINRQREGARADRREVLFGTLPDT